MALKELLNKVKSRLLGKTVEEVLLEERSIIEIHFDEEYYKEEYKVQEDAIDHFLKVGWKNDNNPNAKFSTSYYLKKYPDIEKAGVNPFVHYIEYGKQEGRSPMPDTEIVSKANIGDIETIVAEEFDKEFYSHKYLNGIKFKDGEVEHYLKIGWHLGYDPNENFSTDYYLMSNPDIKASGINPFYHYLKSGRAEGRSPKSIIESGLNLGFSPLVSVIIPNYNHGKFLKTRIESILFQTYRNFEIIILDDCSSDSSREIIKGYAEKYPDLIRYVFNEKNSGNVFRQWKKGVQEAKGELIWICESDDSTSTEFLDKLVPYFIDRSVMISFCKIQFIDQDGAKMEGLDGFREGAQPGIWDSKQVKPASYWFNGPFGVRNIIPNVGGCLIRNRPISEEIWSRAQEFKVLGDWYLYSELVEGGKIAYEPTAESYFRQHGKNTSVTSFKTQRYYDEHYWFIEGLKRKWDISEEIENKFCDYTQWQYLHHFGQDQKEAFSKIFDREKLSSITKEEFHVVIGFLGFHVGGGEIFPIHLANELKQQGLKVSMLALSREDEVSDLVDMLDNRIPVYDMEYVKQIGVESFIENCGVDLINTHYVGVDFQFILDRNNTLDCKYVVTLHGSYEVSDVKERHITQLLRTVDHWIYTADRNLSHLNNIPLAENVLTKVPNAMALTKIPFELTRESMGIKEDAFLFGLMARPIDSKGWEEAILATINLISNTGKDIHLLLVGEGGVQVGLKEKYSSHPNIHFLGFRSNVHGFFKLVDACLLPTRFKGESYPLVLIQSMQVGTPIVSVDIGEIKSMIITENKEAGILIEEEENQNNFVEKLVRAMNEMTIPESFEKYSNDTSEMSKNFQIEKVAKIYKEIYLQPILSKN